MHGHRRAFEKNGSGYQLQMALDRAKVCINNVKQLKANQCADTAEVITLPPGFLFFTGCKNKHANEFSEKGILALIGKESDDTIVRKKAFIMFATPSISAVTKSYGETGGILVTQAQKPLTIHKYIRAACDPYFQGPADYDSEEAQCFCDQGLNGYANGTYNEQSNPFAMDDIAICDAANKSLIKPIGFIPKPFVGDDDKLINRIQPIGNTLVNVQFLMRSYQDQLDQLSSQQRQRLSSRSDFNAPRIGKAPRSNVASRGGRNVPAAQKGSQKKGNCFCLRCRRSVKPQAARMFKTANGRKMIKGNCPFCRGRVACFSR